MNLTGPLDVPSPWTKVGIQRIGIYVHSATCLSVIDTVYVTELYSND